MTAALPTRRTADVSAVCGKAEKIDVLKVGERYSINVTNFGFDTTVAITVNEDRAKTGHGSKNSYTKGIVKALDTKIIKLSNRSFVEILQKKRSATLWRPNSTSLKKLTLLDR